MEKRLVGIVVVSHSNLLADELIKLMQIFKQEEFNIENGGNPSGEVYGTNKETVIKAIKKADSGNGVLVFVDMGSSIFYSLEAKEELKGSIKVEIADAPLVEGTISAVSANFDDISLEELKEIAEDSRNFRKVKK